MNDLTITVNGQAFSGWQDVAVSRSIEQMADAFNLSYIDVTGFNTKPLAIYEGDPCTIKIDGEIIITGFVDDSERGYTASSSTMRVSGRSKICDVIDCAAIYKSGEWFNTAALDIVLAIIKPFGLTVRVADADLGPPIRKFAIQDGETAGSAIDRVCKMRGVLVTSDTQGNIVLTRVGSLRSSTKLQRGVNILTGSYRGSWKERFSEYTIKTQAQGDDEYSDYAVASIKRSVKDTLINRYRPTVIMADNEDSGKELEQRASWERNVRAGRSRSLEYSVQGWRDDDGKLWSPNTLVTIDDDYLRLRDELLITSVAYGRSLQSGTTTQLTLAPRVAYDVQPLPPKKPTRRELLDQ